MGKEVVFVNNNFRAYSFPVNVKYHLQLRIDDGRVARVTLHALAMSLAASFDNRVHSDLKIEYGDGECVIFTYEDASCKLTHHEMYELIQAITADSFKPSIESESSFSMAHFLLIALGGIINAML